MVLTGVMTHGALLLFLSLVEAVAAGRHDLAFPRLEAAADAREVVNFDFNWRHTLGNTSSPRPGFNCSEGTKGVNFGVEGVMHPNVGSAAECCGLCADQVDCLCWDYNVDDGSSEFHACWTKTENCSSSVPNALRYSGQIPAPPPGPAVPAEATPGFDDSAWQLVDAPHDMLIEQSYDPSQSEKMGFLARNIGWYRKHFLLPADWEGTNSSVWLYFEGIFHVTTIWVNGVEVTRHVQGYTSFSVRLDNVPGIHFGSQSENVISIYVDASFGTGWWYEGGGLMRHQYLVRANPVHLNPTGGAWVHAEDIAHSNPQSRDGRDLTAVSNGDVMATFVAEAEVDNDAATASTMAVRATVFDASGTAIATAESPQPVVVPAGASRFQLPAVSIPLGKGVRTWSVQEPYLYTVEVALLKKDVFSNEGIGHPANKVSEMFAVDALNVTAGVRTIRWDANEGLFLNAEHVKLRGFCDHSNFGGVGAALGDRINLFRAQVIDSIT